LKQFAAAPRMSRAAPEHDTADVPRRLALALLVTLVFVAVEAGSGVWANSLALLTDAAHNFTDVIALGLAWYAVRLASRPATSDKTYGYHRAGILIALFNAAGLIVIALVIFYEAYRRLAAPPVVKAGILTGVGAVALVVNVFTALVVRHGHRDDVNLRSAFLHLAGDALAAVGAIAAGIGITLTGLRVLDPAVSMLIGLLIIYNAWGIARETVDILLESTPTDIDVTNMVRDLRSIAGVRGVHDLHVWSITQSMRALSAHVLVDDVSIRQGSAVQRQINDMLLHRYGIGHATLQLECAGCEPDQLFCDLES
jgi:cobalt-zinc-cadmium efflux system protein